MEKLKQAMWAERHRPNTLDECVLEILSQRKQEWFKALVAPGVQMRNVLLYGPPGTGKTTIARILAGNDWFNVMQLNGSTMGKDSIDTVRQFISCIPYKSIQRLVLIDEADGITLPAQCALRALMEIPGSKAAWIMTCNDKGKIIEPLQSRLMQVEVSFPPRADQQHHIQGLVRRCQQVLLAEGIADADENEIKSIVEHHYPDVREIINTLQMEYEVVSIAEQRHRAA